MKEINQIYGRAKKIYYWSPEEGEVCVTLSLNTPSSVLLSRCEDDEPIYMIRRFDPLWSKVAWVFYKPEQLTKEDKRSRWSQMGLTDLDEYIYRRDGKIYYWSTSLGEFEVRPTWDAGLDGYLLVEIIARSKLAGRGYKLPDLPLIDDAHPLWPRLRSLMKKQSNPKKKKAKKNPVNVRDLVRKALR